MEQKEEFYLVPTQSVGCCLFVCLFGKDGRVRNEKLRVVEFEDS